MLTKEDCKRITKIVERYEVDHYLKNPVSLIMDLEFINDEIPLDFEKLLNFSQLDFIHDIAGILANFNRSTKSMENCFLPRCAK